MRFLSLTLLSCLTITTASAFAQESSTAQNAPKISAPYAYATAAQQKNGAVFMVIEGYHQADRLIAAKADIAEITEIHTHLMEDGVMKMRKVEGLDIVENDTLKLKPHGDHIMLLNLKQPLQEGERFPLSLQFEKAGAHIVDVEIVKAGTQPSASISQDHAHDNHAHDDHDHANHSESTPKTEGGHDHTHHSHH